MLIVLRESDLGLDWQPALARARALAKELPPAQSGTKTPPVIIDGARVLALVDLVPPDDYGWPSAAAAAYQRDRLRAIAKIGQELDVDRQSGLAPAVRAVRADDARVQLPDVAAGRAGREAAPVQLETRHRRRTRRRSSSIVTRRAAYRTDPPFKESRARCRASSRRRTVGRARGRADPRAATSAATRELVEAFYAPVPEVVVGDVPARAFNQQIGDCRAALPFYEETIALSPRTTRRCSAATTCLSYGKRHDEAIAAATRMVELRRPTSTTACTGARGITASSDARRRRAPTSRRPRSAPSNDDIHTLAGMIEHDQDDLGASREGSEGRAVAVGRQDELRGRVVPRSGVDEAGGLAARGAGTSRTRWAATSGASDRSAEALKRKMRAAREHRCRVQGAPDRQLRGRHQGETSSSSTRGLQRRATYYAARRQRRQGASRCSRLPRRIPRSPPRRRAPEAHRRRHA